MERRDGALRLLDGDNDGSQPAHDIAAIGFNRLGRGRESDPEALHIRDVLTRHPGENMP